MSQSSRLSLGVDTTDHVSLDSKSLDRSSERMGLLSFTLAPSPGIRWILPARIRNSRSNDVVFVGSTFIQLREFHTQGIPRLSDALARLDFGTQILGAKMISAKVETIPTLDAILDQEYDEERYIINGKPCADDQPPQIVVITTASNDLIYLYAKNSAAEGKVTFVHAKRALIGNIVNSEKHPRHMTIDPSYKVMAVGSHNTFTVFRLKEVDQLTDSILAWQPDVPHSFQPNHEQRMLQVDGHILKMEFLRPSEQEPQKAILLLIVVHNGTSHLLVYNWDMREPLHQMQPAIEPPQMLRAEHRFPLLLVPSSKPASFVLITETHYTYIPNLRYAGSGPISSELKQDPDDPKSIQIWAQSVKPWRHERYSSIQEDIILMREDGYLLVTLRPEMTNKVTSYRAGVLRTSVDSAVCMLPGPRHLGGDILIAAGSMSDGGVYHLPPRKDVYMLQVIPNASPIHDVVLVDSGINRKRDVRAHRTFAIAGQPKSNSPNELRFGYEAQIGWNLPLSNDGPVNRMWVLEHTRSGTLFILTSHLEHTTAISFGLQSEQFSEMDPSIFHGLQLDEPTFAAGMLMTDASVQITSKYIAVGIETETPLLQAIGECICATINSAENIFAIACRIETENNIQVGLLCKTSTHYSIVLSPPFLLSHRRPLCLELFRVLNHQYLAVGFLDGTVEIFLIDSEGGMYSKIKMAPGDHDISAVTSIVALCHANISRMVLLAGTRSGKLRVLKISFVVEGNGVHLAFEVDREYQIDNTPVTVIHAGSVADKSSINALVHSESRLDQITSFRNTTGMDYALSNIWLTQRNDLTWKPPNLTAVQYVQNLECASDSIPRSFLMCAAKGEIMFAEVVQQEQVVPRRVSFNGQRARWMMYSHYLNKLIVASNPADGTRDSYKDLDPTAKYPMLYVVDHDRVLDESEHDNAVILGDHDERVAALLPWEPSDGTAHRSLIVIGLRGELNSRIGCIQQKKLTSNAGNAAFRTIMTFPKKMIYAICCMELSSLVVSVDHELVILKYYFSSKRWHEEARFGLPSPARSLSSQGSVIYAATESHSIVVMRWHRSAKQFEMVFCDHTARNARVVVPFGQNGDHVLFTTAFSEGTCVSAFSMQKSGAGRHSPLFEADMPLGIEQIAPIPSSWTGSKQYAFQGVAFDGTVYVFQTLTNDEWKLLRFLEQLTQPDIATPAKKTSSLLNKKKSKKFSRAVKEGRINYNVPKRMHIQGDVLKRLVDQGPYNLYSLLGAHVKKEEDDMSVDGDNDLLSRLQKLAMSVIGETDDLPAAVTAWTRRMLRATVF